VRDRRALTAAASRRWPAPSPARHGDDDMVSHWLAAYAVLLFS
jgi:hypothetical protein